MIVWQKEADTGAALAALYNAASPVGRGILHYDSAPMEKAEAINILTNDKYVDYYRGRPIKMSFEVGPPCRVDLYDANQGGPGTALRVLEEAKVGGWRLHKPARLPNPTGPSWEERAAQQRRRPSLARESAPFLLPF